MSRYAQIENGVAVNVVLWDGQSPVANSATLVECPEGVSVGWAFANGEWLAPPDFGMLDAPSPSIDDLRHAEYIKPGGADALYMKWQAGEGTEAEWLAERERVRLLYPDPEE